MADKVQKLSLNSGHSMPQIGLGTWLCKPPEVREIVRNAIRNGYRHLDCAFVYGNQTEIGETLGGMFKSGEIRRDELFITSKVWNTFHSADATSKNVDTILEQLGLEYLDLCLIHWPFGYREGGELFPKDSESGKILLSDIDFLETWRALEKKVRDEGKVRAIGLSNFNSAQIQRVIDNCAVKPCVLQVECHPFFQQRKLRDFCKKTGIQFVAFSPLSSSPENPLIKADYPSVFRNAIISKIASSHGKSNAQIALRFLCQLGVGVLPRSRDPKRQCENLAIFDFELSAEEMHEIEGLETNKRIAYLPLSAHSPHFPFGIMCPDDRGQTEFE